MSVIATIRLAVFVVLCLVYAASIRKGRNGLLRIATLFLIALNLSEFSFEVLLDGQVSGSFVAELASIIAVCIAFIHGPVVYWLVQNQSGRGEEIHYLRHAVPALLTLACLPFFSVELIDRLFAISCISVLLYSLVSLIVFIREMRGGLAGSQSGGVMIMVAWSCLVGLFWLQWPLREFLGLDVWVSRPIGYLMPFGMVVLSLLFIWSALTDTIADDRGQLVTKAPSDEEKQRYTRVVDLVSKVEVYSDCDVQMGSVAEMLALTPRELSEAVNRVSGRSFPAFLRQIRVEASQRLLADAASQLSILEVGFASGFGSKTAFNSAFKTETGVTPREWKRQSHDLP